MNAPTIGRDVAPLGVSQVLAYLPAGLHIFGAFWKNENYFEGILPALVRSTS